MCVCDGRAFILKYILFVFQVLVAIPALLYIKLFGVIKWNFILLTFVGSFLFSLSQGV